MAKRAGALRLRTARGKSERDCPRVNPGPCPLLPRGNLLPSLTATDLKTCRFHPDKAPFCPILRVGDVVKFAGQNFAKLASTVRNEPLFPSLAWGPSGRGSGYWGRGAACGAAPPGGGIPGLRPALCLSYPPLP